MEKRLVESPIFFTLSLIAEENRETEKLLLNTSETSGEIGLTWM